MKKFVLAILAAAIVGCSQTQPQQNPEVNWQHDNLAALANTSFQLKSNLWTDQMPKVGEVKETQTLNGLLTLETSSGLPAELLVKLVVVKQGDQSWYINGEETELRAQSENRWEVVFHSDIELDIESTVDVALELTDSDGDAWLVERHVSIDKVY